jgi:hypothetical protein
LKDLEDKLSHQHHTQIRELHSRHTKALSDIMLEKSSLESKLSSCELDLNYLKQEHSIAMSRMKSTIENEKNADIDRLKRDLQAVER